MNLELLIEHLRKTYGQDLTPDQQDHIEGIIYWFIKSVYIKYAKGQAEHGGDLWKKDIVLSELLNETLDFVVYAHTLSRQIANSGVKLGENLPDGELE